MTNEEITKLYNENNNLKLIFYFEYEVSDLIDNEVNLKEIKFNNTLTNQLNKTIMDYNIEYDVKEVELYIDDKLEDSFIMDFDECENLIKFCQKSLSDIEIEVMLEEKR